MRWMPEAELATVAELTNPSASSVQFFKKLGDSNGPDSQPRPAVVQLVECRGIDRPRHGARNRHGVARTERNGSGLRNDVERDER